MKRGNFWGLPVNFLGFSLLTVITTSSTLPVFGQLIIDPVDTVSRIDNTFAAALGAFTFMTARSASTSSRISCRRLSTSRT